MVPVMRTPSVSARRRLGSRSRMHAQRDVELGAGQVRAEAEVRAEPERHHRRRVPVTSKRSGSGYTAGRGSRPSRRGASLAPAGTATPCQTTSRRVAAAGSTRSAGRGGCASSAAHRHRVVEVVEHDRQLLGVGEQRVERAAEPEVGGVGPGREQQAEEVEDLLVGEPLALDLGRARVDRRSSPGSSRRRPAGSGRRTPRTPASTRSAWSWLRWMSSMPIAQRFTSASECSREPEQPRDHDERVAAR